MSRKSVAGEIVLIAVVSFVPFFWRIAAGAGEYPAGDAWAYERIARTYHENGEIVMVGWNDLTLVGMLPVADLWAHLVGFGPWQLHALGSVAGAVLLLGLRDLLRTIGVRHRILPLFVAGTFLGFVEVSGTFLSDQFSVAGAVWGLALVFRLLATTTVPSTTRTVVMSMGAALAVSYGFSVRQNAAAAAVVGAVCLYRARGRLPGAWRWFGGAFVVAALPFYLWRSTLQNGGEVMVDFLPRQAAGSVVEMWTTLGLVALPWAWSTTARRVPHPALLLVVLMPPLMFLAGGLIDAAAPLAHSESLAGHLATAGGPLGWSIASCVVAASAWSWWRVLGIVVRSGWPFADLTIAFAITASLELVALVITGFYSVRYSLLAGFVLMALLQRLSAESAPAAPVRAVDARVLIAAGALTAGSYWVLDVWEAPARALDEIAGVFDCAGVARHEVDGGFAWDGIYYTGVASTSLEVPPDDGLPPTRWQQIFVEMDRRAVVLDAQPSTEYATRTIGPFRSSGVLQFTTVERWIVARDADVERLRECAQL